MSPYMIITKKTNKNSIVSNIKSNSNISKMEFFSRFVLIYSPFVVAVAVFNYLEWNWPSITAAVGISVPHRACIAEPCWEESHQAPQGLPGTFLLSDNKYSVC